MSAPDHDALLREHARRMVADGLSRDEIMWEIRQTYEEHTTDRDTMRKYVFEAEDALRPVGMTAAQRERVKAIRAAVGRLRESDRRLSVSLVADHSGVDRETISRYIDRGWVTLD